MVCDDKWHSVVRVLFFILDEVISVNTTCFVKTMVNARIVVTPLFQMTFQFPKPFFGGLFVGADAFDSESLAVRNTFGAMFRMTTLWGQVLMFICRFVVYVVYCTFINLYVGFPFFYACSFICASSGSFVPYMDRQKLFFEI